MNDHKVCSQTAQQMEASDKWGKEKDVGSDHQDEGLKAWESKWREMKWK